jgi:hypothetical protein
MEEQVRLKKIFGNEFFVAERINRNGVAFIHAQWFGVQSVETVKEGGNKILEMLSQSPCTRLLNSNKEVIGSWDMALEWVQDELVPQLKNAGLRYLAQVVPSSIYATLTIESLIQHIDKEFEVRTFDEEADASAWLLSIKS